MKRLFVALSQALLLLAVPLTISLSGSAAAVNVFPGCPSQTDVCKSVKGSSSTTNPLITFIRTALTILAVIIGVAAVIMLVVSGLQIITANGDAQAVARARAGIINALVGLVIAVMAESLVAFVLNKL